MNKEILTLKDLMEFFRISDPTARRWAKEGRVKGFKTPGGEWRFYIKDILPLLKQEYE